MSTANGWTFRSKSLFSAQPISHLRLGGIDEPLGQQRLYMNSCHTLCQDRSGIWIMRCFRMSAMGRVRVQETQHNYQKSAFVGSGCTKYQFSGSAPESTEPSNHSRTTLAKPGIHAKTWVIRQKAIYIPKIVSVDKKGNFRFTRYLALL